MAGIRDFARNLSMAGGTTLSNITRGKGGATERFFETMTEGARTYAETIKKLNELQAETAEIQAKLPEIEKKLTKTAAERLKVQEELVTAEKEMQKLLKSNATGTAAYNVKLSELKKNVDSLTKREEELQTQQENLSIAVHESKEKFEKQTEAIEEQQEKLRNMPGLLDKLLSKQTAIAVSATVLAANMAQWNDTTKAVAGTLRRFQTELGARGTGGTLAYVANEARALRSDFAQLNSDMARLGASSEETAQIYGSLTRALRSSKGSLRANVTELMELTKQTQILAQALGIDASEAIEMSITMVDKFGMSNRSARDAMASMHATALAVNRQYEEGTFRVEDLTKAVMDASAQTQGFSINTRLLAATMAATAAAAQEQGATYAESLAMAKQLTDVITGTAAPDWAKWRAGGEIIKGWRAALEDMGGNIEATTEEILARDFADLQGEELDLMRKRLTNIMTMVKEGKIDELAARQIAFQYGQASEVAADAMFKQVKFLIRESGQGAVSVLADQMGFSIADAARMVQLAEEGNQEEFKSLMQKRADIEKGAQQGDNTIEKLADNSGKQLAVLTAIEKKGEIAVLKEIAENTAKNWLNNTYVLGAVMTLVTISQGLQLLGSLRNLKNLGDAAKGLKNTANLAEGLKGLKGGLSNVGKGLSQLGKRMAATTFRTGAKVAAGAAAEGALTLGPAGAGAAVTGAAGSGTGAAALGAAATAGMVLGAAAVGAAAGTVMAKAIGAYDEDSAEFGFGDSDVEKSRKKAEEMAGSNKKLYGLYMRAEQMRQQGYHDTAKMFEKQAREIEKQIRDEEQQKRIREDQLRTRQKRTVETMNKQAERLVELGVVTQEQLHSLSREDTARLKRITQGTLATEMQKGVGTVGAQAAANEAVQRFLMNKFGTTDSRTKLREANAAQADATKAEVLGLVQGGASSLLSAFGVDSQRVEAFLGQEQEREDVVAEAQKNLYVTEIPNKIQNTFDKIQRELSENMALSTIASMDKAQLAKMASSGAFMGSASQMRALAAQGVSAETISRGYEVATGQKVKITTDGTIDIQATRRDEPIVNETGAG